MPKAARIRQSKHHASIKLPQASAMNIDEDPQLSLPNLRALNTSLVEPEPEPDFEPHVQQSKKARLLEKREAFLQKLEPGTRQVSKSHQRRLKRKAKEQLTGGLEDIQAVLVSLEKEAVRDVATISAGSQDVTKSKPQIKPGIIGKGSSSTLSKAQRKRVLELERLRHPHILTNSEFSSNPFQTIRTHAQNTLMTQK